MAEIKFWDDLLWPLLGRRERTIAQSFPIIRERHSDMAYSPDDPRSANAQRADLLPSMRCFEEAEEWFKSIKG